MLLLRQISLVAIALLFILGGVNHFRSPGFYLSMMPAYLPAHLLLVQVSGGFEILGGVGVLVPATRVFSGWGLLALLLAVFPANLNMALNPGPFVASGIPLWGLYLRLPLQFLGMAWVWWAAVRQGANTG